MNSPLNSDRPSDYVLIKEMDNLDYRATRRAPTHKALIDFGNLEFAQHGLQTENPQFAIQTVPLKADTTLDENQPYLNISNNGEILDFHIRIPQRTLIEVDSPDTDFQALQRELSDTSRPEKYRGEFLSKRQLLSQAKIAGPLNIRIARKRNTNGGFEFTVSGIEEAGTLKDEYLLLKQAELSNQSARKTVLEDMYSSKPEDHFLSPKGEIALFDGASDTLKHLLSIIEHELGYDDYKARKDPHHVFPRESDPPINLNGPSSQGKQDNDI